MNRPWRRGIWVVTASQALAWLAVPYLAHAAEFNQVFNNVTPVNGALSTQSAINRIFNTRIYLWMIYGVSMAAVFSMLYGGYLYVNSQGKPDQAEKGKMAIIYAIMGLVVLSFSIYVINASRNLGAGIANNSTAGTL